MKLGFDGVRSAPGSASFINERTAFFGDNFVIGYRADRNCYVAKCPVHSYKSNGKTHQWAPECL